jgi:hypothetical protein
MRQDHDRTNHDVECGKLSGELVPHERPALPQASVVHEQVDRLIPRCDSASDSIDIRRAREIRDEDFDVHPVARSQFIGEEF